MSSVRYILRKINFLYYFSMIGCKVVHPVCGLWGRHRKSTPFIDVILTSSEWIRSVWHAKMIIHTGGFPGVVGVTSAYKIKNTLYNFLYNFWMYRCNYKTATNSRYRICKTPTVLDRICCTIVFSEY